ncbi:MAG: hypothetical protein SVK54_00885 [candidate division WOR-3 bacterium]|nr:hypothetical protein [candidate division WOR-3 bacterium]
MKKGIIIGFLILLFTAVFANVYSEIFTDSIFDFRASKGILDSNGYNCEYVGGWYDNVDRILDIWAIDTLLIVCDAANGVHFFSISDPANPRILGTVNQGGYSQRLSVNQSKDVVYVADRNPGVTTISIKDRSNPYIISHTETNDYTYGLCAYSKSANSKALPSTEPDSNILTKIKPFLLSCDRYDGLSLYNVTCFKPFLRSRIMQDIDHPNSAIVYNKYAYVACIRAGLWVVDINNIEYPETVYNVPTGGHISCDVFEKDGYLYLCDGASGLRIFDLSDPVNINEISGYPTRDETHDIVINDYDIGYVAQNDGGFSVFDLSNPYNPQEIAYHCDGSYQARMIFGVDEYIYVGAQSQGLHVFKYTGPALDRFSADEIKSNEKSNMSSNSDSFTGKLEVFALNGRFVSTIDYSGKLTAKNLMKYNIPVESGVYFYRSVDGEITGKLVNIK